MDQFLKIKKQISDGCKASGFYSISFVQDELTQVLFCRYAFCVISITSLSLFLHLAPKFPINSYQWDVRHGYTGGRVLN